MLTRPDVHRKPSTKVEDVLLALQQLLVEPNPDDPLIPAIAEQYRTDKAGFKKEAQLQVKKVCCRGPSNELQSFEGTSRPLLTLGLSHTAVRIIAAATCTSGQQSLSRRLSSQPYTL